MRLFIGTEPVILRDTKPVSPRGKELMTCVALNCVYLCNLSLLVTQGFRTKDILRKTTSDTETQKQQNPEVYRTSDIKVQIH